jgi:sulfhydrogenase subunit delta
MKKPKVAIYDFTDCEGCEVKLVSLREKFLLMEKRLDIIDWRLGQEKRQFGPFDITIIEGTPITKHEIETLKKLREKSKILVGLGACACLGGIPGIIDKKEREKWYKKIYGREYKPKGIDSLPLTSYVKVDFLIHGCPVDENEIVRVIGDLLAGKTPKYRDYSVCFECKQANNKCRLLDGKPCLGPIT